MRSGTPTNPLVVQTLSMVCLAILLWSNVSPLGSARSTEFVVKAGMGRKTGERWNNKGNALLIPTGPPCPVIRYLLTLLNSVSAFQSYIPRSHANPG